MKSEKRNCFLFVSYYFCLYGDLMRVLCNLTSECVSDNWCSETVVVMSAGGVTFKVWLLMPYGRSRLWGSNSAPEVTVCGRNLTYVRSQLMRSHGRQESALTADPELFMFLDH